MRHSVPVSDVAQPDSRFRPTSRHIADPREALGAAVRASGVSMAALFRMIGRDSTYLGRFVAHGVPRMLTEVDHCTLASFFGVNPRELGIRDLWAAAA